MADDADLVQLVVVKQIGQVTGHAFSCGWRLVADRLSAMASCVPAKDAMFLVEGRQKGEPLLMAGGPSVQHDDRRTLAGNFDVKLGAVVGNEVRHGWNIS